MKKIIPALFLSIVLIGNTVIPVLADQLDDALQQRRNIQSEQDKVQRRLNELTYTSDKIKKQISDLEAQTKEAEQTLVQKESAYKQAEKNLENTQKELDELRKDLEERRQVAARRIKAIYEEGNAQYLELLFDATDFNDFITRVTYFQYLVENDQKILIEIRTKQQKVTDKAEELEIIRNQAAQAKKEAAKAKSELDAKKQQQLTLLDQVKKQQAEEWEEAQRLEQEEQKWQQQILKLQAELKNSGSSIGNGKITTWPLPGYYEISSPFGWRIHPVTRKKSKHLGIDIPAPNGTYIVAAASGTVIYSGWDNIYGNWVIIDIGNGMVTWYGHNSKNAVRVGQNVQAGDVVAYVGSTGWSTGPHVDFGVRINGNPVDPLPYFR